MKKWLKNEISLLQIEDYKAKLHQLIYNRENANVKLPLRAHENKSEATSINELIKLFGLYSEIKSIKEQSELEDAQKNAFKKAQDFKYLPNINESQYKKNVIQLRD